MKKSWSIWLAAAGLLAALPLAAQQSVKEAEREAGTAEQYDTSSELKVADGFYTRVKQEAKP